MFLSSEDLQNLTGYKKPKLQRRWLTENGYRFDVRADGRPAVMAEQVSGRQLKGLARNRSASSEPDFTILES